MHNFFQVCGGSLIVINKIREQNLCLCIVTLYELTFLLFKVIDFKIPFQLAYEFKSSYFNFFYSLKFVVNFTSFILSIESTMLKI